MIGHLNRFAPSRLGGTSPWLGRVTAEIHRIAGEIGPGFPDHTTHLVYADGSEGLQVL
jgi:hypothetical protein